MQWQDLLVVQLSDALHNDIWNGEQMYITSQIHGESSVSAIRMLAFFFGILLEVAGGAPVASEPSVSSIHLLLFPEYNALVSLNASAPPGKRCSIQKRVKRNA